MTPFDLTQLKHVGPARAKQLEDAGITSLQQLHEMPLEELAGIKSFSWFYARRIKASVSEYLQENPAEFTSGPLPVKPDKPKEKPDESTPRTTTVQKLDKKIKKLKNRLENANEALKPLWEKKNLSVYIDFKKRYKKLKTRLKKMNKIKDTFPEKHSKKIARQMDTLHTSLKNIGKRPKKKQYRQITEEIQSFSNRLKKLVSSD